MPDKTVNLTPEEVNVAKNAVDMWNRQLDRDLRGHVLPQQVKEALIRQVQVTEDIQKKLYGR